MSKLNADEIKLPADTILEGAKMNELIWFIYGPPGIGKSTFVSKCKDTLFLSTDQGLRFLNVYKRPLASWQDFKKYIKLLRETKPKRYKAIAIDTIDIVFKMCRKYVLDKRGLEHQSDEQWGKAYDLVNTEFELTMAKLCNLPYGIFFISHAKEIEIRGRAVRTNKIVPTLINQAYKAIAPMADIITYMGFDEKAADSEDGRRKMFFQPQETIEAKDRTSKLPETLWVNEGEGFNLVENWLTGKKVKPKIKVVIKRKK